MMGQSQEISVRTLIRESQHAEQFAVVDIDEAYQFLLKSDSIPYQVGDGAIFICLRGKAEAMINMKTYHIKEGDLCILFPYFVIQKIDKSDDFDGYALAVNVEQISNIQVPSIMSYFIYIKENPCISLSYEEQNSLLELCRIITRRRMRPLHIFRKEVSEKLLMAICYEIAAIYSHRKPIAQQAYSRQDTIFRKFLFSLARNYKEYKEVIYYAQEQFMSPRYFSSVIKKKSGMSAAQWIQHTTIREAKLLLDNHKLSVQQVSDELNFPNASFFGQFFKKHTGMTPKRYQCRNQ